MATTTKPYPRTTDKCIRISYDIVTPASAAEGDVAERGWEDEAGVEAECDYDMTYVQWAIAFLRRKGATMPSASSWDPRVWYSAHEDMDFRTGEAKTLHYHLSGFTDEESEDIFDFLH